jgi:transposase
VLNPLENLSKQELIALVKTQNEKAAELEKANVRMSRQSDDLTEKCQYLEYRVAQLIRMLFGQKRERFENQEQPELPFEPTAAQQQQAQEQVEEKITYTRKKAATGHKGRAALPAHLPVEEVEIHPEGDLSDMVVSAVCPKE